MLFSHGFSGWREQSTFLTTHLASWGFVVASPDFLERGLGAQLGAPPAITRTEDDVIERRRSPRPAPGVPEDRCSKGKIAIVGHSAGGGTAIRYADQPNVLTYIPMSSGAVRDRNGGAPPMPPQKPSMYITGRQDGIAEFDRVEHRVRDRPGAEALRRDRRLRPPERDERHLRDRQGRRRQSSRWREEAGIPVPAEPGAARHRRLLRRRRCPSKQVWPVTRHFVTAQLRYEFGLDERPVGLQRRTS